MTTDPRYAQLHANDWIPLALGHKAVGKSQQTVYRWAQHGKLELLDTADGTLVQVGSLRATEASVKPGRRRRPIEQNAH